MNDILLAVIYAHSLIPGGIPADYGYHRYLQSDMTVWVNYQDGDSVRWTSTTLRKGELVITDRDGRPLKRGRCGNDIALTPPEFVAPKPPDTDTPFISWVEPPWISSEGGPIAFDFPPIPKFIEPDEPVPPPVVIPPGLWVVPYAPVWWGNEPVPNISAPEIGSFWMILVGIIYERMGRREWKLRRLRGMRQESVD